MFVDLVAENFYRGLPLLTNKAKRLKHEAPKKKIKERKNALKNEESTTDAKKTAVA